MATLNFSAEHAPALGALQKAAANPEANQTIADLLLNGIPWVAILTVLIQEIPDMEAGNWTAVVQALLALNTEAA